MGNFSIRKSRDAADSRSFMNALIRDLNALEKIIEDGLIESGINRIGAEQELCLIDKHQQPAPIAHDVLSGIDDPRFTHELSKFNLEINLDPIELINDAFTQMEYQLTGLLNQLQERLSYFEANYILVGILPTILMRYLTIDHMTSEERYFTLNDALRSIRGRDFEFRIQGLDELLIKHDSVMVESCNTSFQIHYQLDVDSFPQKYNWCQFTTAPVLAISTNSPLFLGKRLWHETRIALFNQSIDTRGQYDPVRLRQPRVFIGDNWLTGNITNIYKNDLAMHRPVVVADIDEDPFEKLKNGEIPKLTALNLHNGTIYKWNRPCYGITNGKPHLRIENRYLPSGPSAVDEIATSAFWIGLMHGMPKEYSRLSEAEDFDIVKSNFINVARNGIDSKIKWTRGRVISIKELVLKELLPIAYDGLKKASISKEDIDKYLSIIEKRIKKNRTGSQWLMEGYDKLKKNESVNNIMIGLTAGIVNRQKSGKPVHQWDFKGIENSTKGKEGYRLVEQIMSRELFTIQEEDVIDLGPSIMKWHKIRHVLVENNDGDLVGVLTLGRLGRYYAEKKSKDEVLPVKDIMTTNPVTIKNYAFTEEAIKLMEEKNIGCLPVLDSNDKLVGIITERDILKMVSKMIAIS